MKVLVADLDGTLLWGDPADRSQLHAALSRHPEVTVVFATGRGLPSVVQALRDPLLPRPRWIIADVGSSIIDGQNLAPVDALQTQQRSGWLGPQRIRAALSRFRALTYQHGVVQDGRCSFYLAPQDLASDITDAVQALGCTWSYSDNRYFDVLPCGVDKGSALVMLARENRWPMTSILVAGDSLNDLSLFGLGAHGVIVSNAEPALQAAAPVGDMIHRPDQPGAAGILCVLQDMGWVERVYPVVIGYHRPPVNWTEYGWQPPRSPNGILPTLRSVFSGNLQAVWVSAMVTGLGDLTDSFTGHGTGLPLSFMPVTPAEWAGYFHHACKDTLWPVLMSQPMRLSFDASAWAYFRAVNTRFADLVSAQAALGATVWLHDYNLWLVPGVLRSTRPDLRLGLFHHAPFPPAAIFNTLPTAPEIRASLSCLDWVGFHTETFAKHFQQSMSGVPRVPRLGVYPLSVDRQAIEELARGRYPYRAPADGRLVLSVERLDYIKAPVQKVEAIAGLLARCPEYQGRLQFRLVCPPPEPGIVAYDATRRTLEHRIAQVNTAWGTDTWRPIDYLPYSLSSTDLMDQYLAADIFWVASLQDGMNLTVKEFIAAQAAVGLCGAVVLSRYVGAAAQLGGAALLTDPNSPANLIDTLQQALGLTPDERHARMEQLADLLGHHHPREWASQIIAAIKGAAEARVPGRSERRVCPAWLHAAELPGP